MQVERAADPVDVEPEVREPRVQRKRAERSGGARRRVGLVVGRDRRGDGDDRENADRLRSARAPRRAAVGSLRAARRSAPRDLVAPPRTELARRPSQRRTTGYAPYQALSNAAAAGATTASRSASPERVASISRVVQARSIRARRPGDVEQRGSECATDRLAVIAALRRGECEPPLLRRGRLRRSPAPAPRRAPPTGDAAHAVEHERR